MKSDFTVYIGTYTRRDSEGIYVYKMDLNSGKLSYSSKVTGIENPSFLVNVAVLISSENRLRKIKKNDNPANKIVKIANVLFIWVHSPS